MKLGRKSIFKTFSVNGTEITIHADKQFRICNLLPKIENQSQYYGRQINDESVISQILADYESRL